MDTMLASEFEQLTKVTFQLCSTCQQRSQVTLDFLQLFLNFRKLKSLTFPRCSTFPSPTFRFPQKVTCHMLTSRLSTCVDFRATFESRPRKSRFQLFDCFQLSDNMRKFPAGLKHPTVCLYVCLCVCVALCIFVCICCVCSIVYVLVIWCMIVYVLCMLCISCVFVVYVCVCVVHVCVVCMLLNMCCVFMCGLRARFVRV